LGITRIKNHINEEIPRKKKNIFEGLLDFKQLRNFMPGSYLRLVRVPIQ